MPVPISGMAVIEWGELKQAFLTGYNGGKFSGQSYNRHNVWRKGKRWDSYDREWYGGMTSPDQMAEYIRNGFSSPEFPVGEEFVTHSQGRQFVFADEGELDLTLAWSGHDYPYLNMIDVESKPGIRIVAEFGFSSGTEAKFIARYGSWLYGILCSLEAQGYDLELDLSFTTGGQNSTVAYPRENFQTIIRLKREGELSDFSDWSALFSPAGYRLLMFLATELTADKVNGRRNGSLGRCNINTTSVAYDAETGILRIEPSQRGSSDLGHMLTLVNEALGIAAES